MPASSGRALTNSGKVLAAVINSPALQTNSLEPSGNLLSKSGKTLPIVAEFDALPEIAAILPAIALNMPAIYPGAPAIYPGASEFLLKMSAIYPKSSDKTSACAAITPVA